MCYSIDLRTSVINYINNGGKISKACDIFSVSRSSIQRWRNKKEQIGNFASKSRVAAPYKIDTEELKTFVENNPDAYLSEIAAHFNVSESGICRALIRLKITRKKSPHYTQNVTRPSEQDS